MRRIIMFCGATALLVPLLGCGSARPFQPSSVCEGIAADYADALPAAIACDPAVAQSCAASRPIVVAESTDGGTVVQGLCDCRPSAGFVNPAQTAALDDILSRFLAAGCSFSACPCPAHPQDAGSTTGTCRAADGGATCS